MSLSQTLEKIPDFGRDIRLNLDTLLKSADIPGLTDLQRAGIAVACAYSVETPELIQSIEEEYAPLITPEVRHAAQGAATLMAMNNVYYRFLHLADDPELKKLPAKLRMNLIGKPGIPKVDFELMCRAVSAIAGCGSCIQAHVHEVKKVGITPEGIQTTVRIASVINAAGRALHLI